MDEQAAGSVALGLVVLVMTAFLALTFLPRWGVGSAWLGAAVVLITAVMIVAAAEGRRR